MTTRSNRRIMLTAIDQAFDGENAWGVFPAAESGWIAWFGIPAPDGAEFTKKVYKYGFACPVGLVGEQRVGYRIAAIGAYRLQDLGIDELQKLSDILPRFNSLTELSTYWATRNGPNEWVWKITLEIIEVQS